MTRRRRGSIAIVIGIVAILTGLLIAPQPWVLLWGPGILLVLLGYSHATDPRPDENARPGYINDPWKDKR